MELAQYVAAVRHLSDAIRTKDSGPNRVRRAYVHLLVRNHGAAAADARAALERAGSTLGRYAHSEVEAHWILAVHHVRRSNHIEALRHCRQALSHPATKGYPPVQVAKLERLLKILERGKPDDPSKGEEAPAPPGGTGICQTPAGPRKVSDTPGTPAETERSQQTDGSNEYPGEMETISAGGHMGHLPEQFCCRTREEQ